MAARQGSQAKRWCFTINNPNISVEQELERIFTEEIIKYCIVGREMGEQGTPHLQGYIHLKAKRRFTAIKKMLPRAHIERAQGSDEDNATYCGKEGNLLLQIGTPQKGDEHGGDGGKIQICLKRRIEGISSWDLATDGDLGGTYVRSKNNIEALVKDRQQSILLDTIKTSYDGTVWKTWQADILALIREDPDPRTIMWYWERTGNIGKSFIAKYLATKGAFVINSAKSADIAYAYNGENIIVFDLSRSMEERINYDVMEQLKNGRIFSPKYEAKVKVYNIPHVIVLANFPPDYDKMSADRWNVTDLE